MIRRLPRAVTGAVALAAIVLASGCSSFANNKNAATADGHDLSVKSFDKVVSELQKSNIVDGQLDGTRARSMLTQWIQSTVVTDELAAKGYVIDDAVRPQTETTMETNYGDDWRALSPESQSFLIDVQTPFNIVNDSEDFVPAADLQALYESGAAQSGVFCLRVMYAADQATATDIVNQLGNGGDFATIADQNPAPGQQTGTGGVLAAPTTGVECIPAGQLSDLAPTIANYPIGTPSDPVQQGTGFYFFLQRPFTEVAADVRTVAGAAVSGPKLADLAKGQRATVDSRYGSWDASTAKVVPAN